MKIRYSRRRDTADHHALRLRRKHRCSSQPQADFWHPTGFVLLSAAQLAGGVIALTGIGLIVTAIVVALR